jgi:two-component system chemotaxis response regulator CheY
MKEIVDWLIDMEEIAGNLYEAASKQFNDDHTLSTFLRHMAEDEGWHYHIMGSAAEYLRKEKDVKSELAIDSSIKEKIEAPFTRNYEMLLLGTLTKESMINCLIETEYSEWNHIFLYVINTLKQRSREFMYVAARMQHHIEEISEFLESLPTSDQYLDKILRLPEVWEKKILIVDDYDPTRLLFISLLEDLGIVETVKNGIEALTKVKESYFDVVVSDIEMPLMNGIDFCKEAIKVDPNIISRIIYCSSSHDENYLKFIKSNSIPLIIKPFNIVDIRSYVRKILSRTN